MDYNYCHSITSNILLRICKTQNLKILKHNYRKDLKILKHNYGKDLKFVKHNYGKDLKIIKHNYGKDLKTLPYTYKTFRSKSTTMEKENVVVRP